MPAPDPDQLLQECVDFANSVLDDEAPFYPDNLGQDATSLAEAFRQLHTVMTSGGPPPAEWKV